MDSSSQETTSPAGEKRSWLSSMNLAGVAAVLVMTGIVGTLQATGLIDLAALQGGAAAGLAGNADDAVARVNGEVITRGELEERFSQVEKVLSAQGADVSDPTIASSYREQLLDEMISNTLLVQKAQEAGISITTEEVDASYNELLELFGGEAGLDEQLAVVGLTKEGLRENLQEQLAIEAYLAQATSVDEIEVTDEEVRAYYDANVAQNENADPAEYDQMVPILRQQLAQQKASALIAEYIDTLKQEADIEVLL